MHLVVLTNGWVFVGRLNGNTLENSKNIRYWGTKQGLGELRDGPTDATTFDEYGNITINPDQILFTFSVKGW